MAFTTQNRRTQTELAEINMIPFIDIMLVLLIVFMITAPVIQSGIEVTVPRTRSVRQLAEDRLVVIIDADQTIYLQNEEININELGPRILELQPDSAVVYLRIDENVPWGTMAPVMDRLNQSGIVDINLVTELLNESGQ